MNRYGVISFILLCGIITGCTFGSVNSHDIERYYVSGDSFDPVIESGYLIQAGITEYRRGDYLDASVYFQRAIGFDFYNPEPHLLLASCYYNLGWYNMAAFEFDRTTFILGSSEWRGFVFYLLGRTYEKQGKLDDAYGKYKEARASGYSSPELEQKLKNEEGVNDPGTEENELQDIRTQDKKKSTEFEKKNRPDEFYKAIKLK
ncbi:MAG: hypothetical protein PHV06_08015 [bacterium]|nr:hypothetical protein [bacterium]